MNMNIIAHRGCWFETTKKNSEEAFCLALNNGFGIETDIRDFDNEIVISHDIPDRNSMLFSDFISLVKNYHPVTLALNVKSDGLQKKIIQDLNGYEDYFVFDMSIPDALGYQNQGITNYTRFSDVEPFASLLNNAQGVWVDNFSDNALDVDSLNDFLQLSKMVALVSPELHKLGHLKYWDTLKTYLKINPEHTDFISLCTDFPTQAKEFFNE
jgi:glycerophosphoryl diester phosphodiesterase